MTDAAPSPAPLFQLSTAFWAFKTLATAYEPQLFAGLSGDIWNDVPGVRREVADRRAPYHFGGLITMLDRRLYSARGRLIEAVYANQPVTWDSGRERSLFESQNPDVAGTFWEAMHTLSSCTLIETEGRAYAASEYANWLIAAGFIEPHPVPLESVGANGVISARKPGV
jgi:hypothetical protein